MTLRDQRTLTASSLLCLAPIVLGIALWGLLPDWLAIAWNSEGVPFMAPKAIALIGLPVVAALVQVASVHFAARFSSGNLFVRRRFTWVLWLIPVLFVVLYLVMLGSPMLGLFTPRRTSLIVLASALLLIGVRLPSMSYATAAGLPAPLRPRSILGWRQQSEYFGHGFVAASVLCAVLSLVL